MNLIIVESPTKEKTISKFLEKKEVVSQFKTKFVVKSCYGHIRDLPKNALGIDEKNNFKPTYIILPKAKNIISTLKKLTSEADNVYLATDFDREGEAIASHLAFVLKLDDKKVKRITFHEITPQAINDALKNPRGIENNLVESQQARRILDRLVGYKLSPLLWKKIANKLSAGRVQSVALKFINDREEEIEKFVPQEYWTIEANFYKNNLPENIIKTKLKFIGEKKLDKLDIKTSQEAENILKEIKSVNNGTIIDIKTEKKIKSPSAPFVTSTLQQEASWKLKFSPSKTMFVAQGLYEGIDLGGEDRVGLITYMRTDSVFVSEYANNELRKFINETYSTKYLHSHIRKYKTKIKNAQEAHEAIRPTSVYRTPENVKQYLTEDQYKLYELIWKKFVATQMKDMEYENTNVKIKVGDKYIFEAEGKKILFDGYTVIYPEDKEEDILPPININENLVLKECINKQHFTEPLPRYTEASLIKELEKNGIGRPSTYATIVDTLKVRGYVVLKERKFNITPLGKQVIQLLTKYFPEIVNKSYTAKIEKLLDKISEGQEDWVKVIKTLYNPLKKDLEKASQEIKSKTVIRTEIKCTLCGAMMVIRDSRFGKFLSCEKFPKCKHKMKYELETSNTKTS